MATLNRFTATPYELPLDVRLMRAAASALMAAAVLGLLVLGVTTFVRQPWFALQSIRVVGEVDRSNESTLRANVAAHLRGNFFTVNLDEARRAFEAAPWVRRAIVSREWPNRLSARLEEHVPAAVWLPEGSGEAAADTLVNTFGEVFQTNFGEVEDDTLPTLSGPKGSAASMLDLLRLLAPVFEQLDSTIVRLTLSSRGSWRVALANGVKVELGRGSNPELIARSRRFVETIGAVTARYERPLQYADLRHRDGYAVRLRGITTLRDPQKNTRK